MSDMMTRTFRVHLAHDGANDIWYVESSDLPGLFVEAPTIDEAIAVARDAAPHLARANLAVEGMITLRFTQDVATEAA